MTEPAVKSVRAAPSRLLVRLLEVREAASGLQNLEGDREGGPVGFTARDTWQQALDEREE